MDRHSRDRSVQDFQILFRPDPVLGLGRSGRSRGYRFLSVDSCHQL